MTNNSLPEIEMAGDVFCAQSRGLNRAARPGRPPSTLPHRRSNTGFVSVVAPWLSWPPFLDGQWLARARATRCPGLATESPGSALRVIGSDATSTRPTVANRGGPGLAQTTIVLIAFIALCGPATPVTT